MSGSKFCKKAKGNAWNSKNTKASEVTIQIGVMIWKDRKLATRRGSSFPLKVPSNAISEVLKDKAEAKRNRFNSSLIKSDKALGYKLLYPDKAEVLRDFMAKGSRVYSWEIQRRTRETILPSKFLSLQ